MRVGPAVRDLCASLGVMHKHSAGVVHAEASPLPASETTSYMSPSQAGEGLFHGAISCRLLRQWHQILFPSRFSWLCNLATGSSFASSERLRVEVVLSIVNGI